MVIVGLSPIRKLVVGGQERVAHCESKQSPKSLWRFVYRVVLGDMASLVTFRYKFDAVSALCLEVTGSKDEHQMCCQAL